jgi:hypothetical protein
MTGTNFSDWYNASEGTFVATAYAPNGQISFSRILEINDTTGNNRMLLSRNNAAISCLMTTGGASQASMAPTGTWSNNAIGTIAFAYKANDLSCAFSANSVATDNAATIPTLTQMQIGAGAGAAMSNATFTKINFYSQRLTNSEVQSFSKV